MISVFLGAGAAGKLAQGQGLVKEKLTMFLLKTISSARDVLISLWSHTTHISDQTYGLYISSLIKSCFERLRCLFDVYFKKIVTEV